MTGAQVVPLSVVHRACKKLASTAKSITLENRKSMDKGGAQ